MPNNALGGRGGGPFSDLNSGWGKGKRNPKVKKGGGGKTGRIRGRGRKVQKQEIE